MSTFTVTMNCLDVISKPKWVLEAQGLVPCRRKRKLLKLKRLLHCIIFTVMLSALAMNVIWGIRSNKPMFVNRMMCIFIPVLNVVAKVLTVHKNRKHYLLLLQYLTSDIFNIDKKGLNPHIQLVKKIVGLLLKYFAVTIAVFFFVVSILPIVIGTEPLIPCPFDIGRYDILYRILHLPVAGYLAINSPSFDLLFMSLLGICIGQLNILEERLTSLGNSNDTHINPALQKSLIECIDLHKTINEYVEKVTVILSLPLFIQYSCGCFIICNTVLQLIIMKGKTTLDVIMIVTYTTVAFTQTAVYHWLGNEIMYQSSKIVEACYLSKWYTLDRKSQKCLLLLMEGAKKPLTIKLYTLIDISLGSLTVIIRWSYSLFALMKATYSQNS